MARARPATPPGGGPPAAGGPPVLTEESCRFRLGRFDGQIRIEFELIGHRMTWLVISQSFLFSAFATTLGLADRADGVGHATKALRLLLPWLGMLAALLAGIAIAAAHAVIIRLKGRRDDLEQEAERAFGYDRLGVSGSTWPHLFGNAASVLLPWVLVAVWAFLLWELSR